MSKKKLVCEICGEESGEWRKVSRRKTGQLICDNCEDCPSCNKPLKTFRKSWEGDQPAECPKCHEIFLDLRAKRKFDTYRPKKNITYVPLAKQSKSDYRLRYFVRLEKIWTGHANPDGSPIIRVIEIGYFHHSGQDNYRLLSQIGTCNFHVDPDDKKPNLKKWEPVHMSRRIFPDITGRWGMSHHSLERHVKKLRARGWRVVANKDRNGRTERVAYSDRLTLAEELHEKKLEQFDENAGDRHQKKLERIDEKYYNRAGKVETGWLEENIGARN